MHGRVIDDLENFPGPVFQSPNEPLQFLRDDEETELYQIWEDIG